MRSERANDRLTSGSNSRKRRTAGTAATTRVSPARGGRRPASVEVDGADGRVRRVLRALEPLAELPGEHVALVSLGQGGLPEGRVAPLVGAAQRLHRLVETRQRTLLLRDPVGDNRADVGVDG